MSDRKYPDIDFVETDTETIESNLIALYENFVQQVPGRERYKVYPASPERLFISWVANIIVQQRVIINETAKKNVPRYADIQPHRMWKPPPRRMQSSFAARQGRRNPFDRR